MEQGNGARVALVTGGAGFIGSHLVGRLLQEGWRVAVIDDLSTGNLECLSPDVEFLETSVSDPRVVTFVGAWRPSTIFHLAAQIDVRRSVANPIADASVNILGALNVMRAAQSAGVRRLVFSSTGGAMYGEPRRLPVSERARPRPDSPYGVAKRSTELYLHFYQSLYQIHAASLRYGNVYGPRQCPDGEAGVVAIFTSAMLKGIQPTIFGDGEQLRDYVYVDDVVEANLAACRCNLPYPINIGTGVGTSVNTIYRKLAFQLGFPMPARYAQARPGEVKRCYLDCSAARRYLGWTAKVPLDGGLGRTIEHFRGYEGRIWPRDGARAAVTSARGSDAGVLV